MHQLIPILSDTLDGDTVQTVNARDLHAHLEVGRDFSNWIKERIETYGFVEGEDYLVFAKSGENSDAFDSPNPANQTGRGGDRRSIDYHLSLDMAKELAMVERNEKGRQARRYFIACEKALKRQITHLPELLDTQRRLIASQAGQLADKDAIIATKDEQIAETRRQAEILAKEKDARVREVEGTVEYYQDELARAKRAMGPVSTDEWVEIVGMRRMGMSYAQISRDTYRSHHTIARICREARRQGRLQ